MKVSTASLHPSILRTGSPLVLAIGALTLLSARAHALDLDPITISAPIITKTLEHDEATDAPTEKITVNAEIAADAETLRNDSGVVLLKDRVAEAARKACDAAGRLAADDEGTCVFEAVKSAKPQVDAAIARARSTSVAD